MKTIKPTLHLSDDDYRRLAGTPGSAAKAIEALIRGQPGYPSRTRPQSSGTDNKGYPPAPAARYPWTDNVALWINGINELKMRCGALARDYDERIQEIEHRISRIHTKKVKGHVYYYESDGNGGHTYRGKDDPVPVLRKTIEARERMKQDAISRARSCVIAKVRGHLIIWAPETGGRISGDVIPFSKLDELSRKLSGNPQDPWSQDG